MNVAFTRQRPYQEEVEVEGQKIPLPFTNTLCEVALAKKSDGMWVFVRRWGIPLFSDRRHEEEVNQALREAAAIVG